MDNNLAGPINLQAGSGGSGLSGGVGGAVTNFFRSIDQGRANQLHDSQRIRRHATVGTGGAGGSISGMSIAASDVAQDSKNSRMVAGAGGSVPAGRAARAAMAARSSPPRSAANAQNVLAAGAGGNGLTAGGSWWQRASSQANRGAYCTGAANVRDSGRWHHCGRWRVPDPPSEDPPRHDCRGNGQ